jgi:hypothetical protein
VSLKSSMASFRKLVSLTMFLVPMPINKMAQLSINTITLCWTCLACTCMYASKFWDESFLTTTFLINLLPRKVIDFETTGECLLHTKPNYDSSDFWVYLLAESLSLQQKKACISLSKRINHGHETHPHNGTSEDEHMKT